jgi:two-component system NarL family sensor kinase
VSIELTTLTALATALSRPAELTTSLEGALATIAEMLGLETGWVLLLDERTGAPRLAASRALPPRLRDHPTAMLGDCYCLTTFREGDLRGAANVNVVWCSRLAKVVEAMGDGAPLRCHASVPLVVGERRLGMLNVASADWRVLTDDELHLLTTAGVLVSLVVERSRLERAGLRAAASEERNRIAREVHDTLAQVLAGLTMHLEATDAMAAARGDEALEQAVSRALALARAALDEARRSVLELREAPLEGRTLARALGDLAAELGSSGAAPAVELSVDGLAEEGRELPAAVEIGVYRIAQQALANAARHARASRVCLRLSLERGGEDGAPAGRVVRLRVEDDGAGFEPARVPAGRYGLLGMSERARLLGGALTVESAPGEGTTVHVEIPLRPPRARAGEAAP